MFDICVFNLALEKSLIATYHIYGVLWFHLQNRVFPPPSGEAGDGIGFPEAPLLQCWPLTHARTHTCTWNKISKTSEAWFKRYAVSQRTSHQAHIYRLKLLFTTGSRFYLQNRGDWVAGECHGSSGDFQFIKTVHKYHIVSHLGKCPAQR